MTTAPNMTTGALAGSSNKRVAEASQPHSTIKKAKLAPIFLKKANVPSAFRWEKPNLGPNKTLLHGVNLEPKTSPKIAAFDLDDTLIRSTSPNAIDGKWKWWASQIPVKLKELYEDGYCVVILSNQAQKSTVLKYWEEIKIPNIAVALNNVPFRIFGATAKDGYRKPMPGMWYEIERIFREDDIDIDKESSFFVGNAAGRPDDHACSDRKWALNVGIRFFTPEEYFLKVHPQDYILPGWDVSKFPKKSSLFTPTNTPLIPIPSKPPKADLVLFVGFPCLGKTSFYRRHFWPNGYIHINQDILKRREKCIQAVEDALKAGQSCVVDNTNRDVKTRKYYIDVARKFGVLVRCFLFEGDISLAWHNNLYRAFNMPSSAAAKESEREMLPYLAIAGFEKGFQIPTLAEGFQEIKTIHWVFEGDPEAERRWGMWLQLDDKMPRK